MFQEDRRPLSARLHEPLTQDWARWDSNIPENLNKKPNLENSGAESGAQCADSPPDDPELHAIINAWPSLPRHVQAALHRMAVEARLSEEGAA